MINENIQSLFFDKNEYNYEEDYNIKLSNQNYRKYLNFENQLSYNEFNVFFNNNKQKISDEINSIKKNTYIKAICTDLIIM